MPAIQCVRCGFMTNTAISNHLFPMREDGKANECFLRWENEVWSKGCAYDKLTESDKRVYANLLNTNPYIHNEKIIMCSFCKKETKHYKLLDKWKCGECGEYNK